MVIKEMFQLRNNQVGTFQKKNDRGRASILPGKPQYCKLHVFKYHVRDVFYEG